MVIAVSASREGCRGGNPRFPADRRRAAGQCHDRSFQRAGLPSKTAWPATARSILLAGDAVS
jgi:hypothetical protein